MKIVNYKVQKKYNGNVKRPHKEKLWSRKVENWKVEK